MISIYTFRVKRTAYVGLSFHSWLYINCHQHSSSFSNTAYSDYIEGETKIENKVYKNSFSGVNVLRCLVIDNRRLLNFNVNKHTDESLFHKGRFGALSKTVFLIYLLILFIYIILYNNVVV
jgi:hypothetical protein